MLNDAGVWGMVHHNLVVKGPLFPLFPEGWEGPQARYEREGPQLDYLHPIGC